MKKSTKKLGPKEIYNPKVHDKAVKETFSKGLFQEDFCETYDICRATFYNWIKKYPSFKEAVEKGKTHGEAKWARMPLKFQQKTFSYPYWSSIMKNKFGWGCIQIEGVTGKETPLELVNKALLLFTSGKVKSEQIDKLLNVVMTKVKVIECDNHEERLQRLEKNSGIS